MVLPVQQLLFSLPFLMVLVQSRFYNLGTSNPHKGIQAALHENTFDVDEEAIKIGVCLQVLSALHLLEQ